MRREKTKNRRQETVGFLVLAVSLLAAVTLAGIFLKDAARETDFGSKNLAPSMSHLFGTDWMGRDMFARTLAGLSLSIRIGLLTACVSAGIALLMGTGAAVLGRRAHILLVILISLACGKGFLGVAAGVSFSHWPSLSRVIRGEVLQLRQAPYVLAAGKLGAGKLQVAGRHMLPHVLPQFLTGLILLFPHAILHESSVTFLGFGLSAEQPAIGVILSESMQYLTTGKWWLALFPGISLVLTVALFVLLGERARRLLDSASVHE